MPLSCSHAASFTLPYLPLFAGAVDKPVEAINPSIYVKATTQFQSMVLTLGEFSRSSN